MNGHRALIGFISVITCAVAVPAFAHDLNRPVPIKPEYSRPGTVRLWDPSFATKTEFSALPASAKYGGSLASGDLDGDGKPEIIVGSGPGVEPWVNIFTQEGSKVRSFIVGEKTFRGGVRVASGDIDGDGNAEIIVAFGPGMQPLIKTYRATGEKISETLAYAKTFTGGVHLATSDINRDSKIEIITSPGPGGGSHIRIWNGDLTNTGFDFFAFDPAMRDGTSIATLRTGTGPAIIAAPESWSEPLVRRFILSPTPTLTKEFYAFDAASKNGVALAAFDADGDGTDEIAAAQNGGTSPEVRLFDLFGTKIAAHLLHDPTYRGALSVMQLSGTAPRLMTMPSAAIVVGSTTSEKAIYVNLAEQRLYAYEHGRLARTFLVSTGVPKYPTPTMETSVLTKIPVKRYAHSYGKDHPDNYDLPNVKYNLQIKGPYYIHYAYWHNNFGHRMSHGCVNVGLKDSEWVYNWADVGLPVTVR